MKIVITGAGGLLGWHLRSRLSVFDRYRDETVALDRAAFNDPDQLAAALDGADAVVHCAGINRASDEELEGGNEALAQRLVDALTERGARPHLVYTNTIHRDQDNAYGRGKARAHRNFEEWALSTGARYTELVLPHVFGDEVSASWVVTLLDL